MLTELIAFRSSKEDKTLLFKRAKDKNISVGNLIRGVMSDPQKTKTDKKIEELQKETKIMVDKIFEKYL